MNRNKLKTYAPAARRDFIQAVKDRATLYGLSAKKIEPMTERGDVVIIAGEPFPKTVAAKRRTLEKRIERDGYERTMEAAAYTWFNRLVAIRFMELHGYLDHGYRVLSHPAGGVQPEILDHAQRLDFPDLDQSKVLELKLDGTKQEELYRLLLVAQCNALNKAMPFLFERIDDETELLLPANLLASDSLIRKLVDEIDEADWQEVEILGWLYQFYISERKEQVIGKVVASEDIPAATQLFTPNWIVKYLVQNTLGRIWLATYPQSGIRQQMEFYIEPAEQTPEVQEQLKAITPTSLNPEELTLLDPACGSAHILVEAYDLFKAIYQERGYRAKDIPGLILSKNLFGLEIDDRAAQLAAFALLMKARADDRRILEAGVQPNILAFVESKGMDAEAITHALNSPIRGGAEGNVAKADIAALLELFEEAKTFGALVQIPVGLAERLPVIEEHLAKVLRDGDLTHAQSIVIAPLMWQARLLARRYDAVVANPPYMGSKYFTPALRAFITTDYKEAKADLYACFIERSRTASKPRGFYGMINIPNWMFLSSFEDLRKSLFETQSIETFVHNGRGVFGSDFGSCAFVIRNAHLPEYRGCYRRLFEKQGSVASNEELERRFHTAKTYSPSNADFARIPGSPVAYWVSPTFRELFEKGVLLGQLIDARQGMATADNDKFLRRWQEVTQGKSKYDSQSRAAAAQSGSKWFPYNKGGAFRRWFGNHEFVVNWESDGRDLYAFRPRSVIRSPEYYFQESLTWSDVTSGPASFRLNDRGGIHDVAGMSAFAFHGVDRSLLAGYCNTPIVLAIARATNPTLHFQIGDFVNVPFLQDLGPNLSLGVKRNVQWLSHAAKSDWDAYERSWDFQRLPLLTVTSPDGCPCPSLEASYSAWVAGNRRTIAETKRLEEENNRLFIDAYGLADELDAHVPIDQITLTVNPAYRYGASLTDDQWSVEHGFGDDLEARFRTDTCEELISYAVGCMMGRYSLDEPGLIYAHAGNEGFAPSRYRSFPADDDGIIPVTDFAWFDDDACSRLVKFLSVAWPSENHDANIAFLASSLDPKREELPRDTLRRYLAGGFYKHHLQTYKNRPIYWLFTSGKQGAFEALVYLHRYHDGTLSRMRTEYVVPLLGKISGRIGMLSDTIASANSTKQRKDAEKEKDRLTKQQAELQAFDEKLRHYADQRISLDLDDGVKVNYGKFGDLLADVKKVCGTKDEE